MATEERPEVKEIFLEKLFRTFNDYSSGAKPSSEKQKRMFYSRQKPY